MGSRRTCSALHPRPRSASSAGRPRARSRVTHSGSPMHAELRQAPCLRSASTSPPPRRPPYHLWGEGDHHACCMQCVHHTLDEGRALQHVPRPVLHIEVEAVLGGAGVLLCVWGHAYTQVRARGRSTHTHARKRSTHRRGHTRERTHQAIRVCDCACAGTHTLKSAHAGAQREGAVPTHTRAHAPGRAGV